MTRERDTKGFKPLPLCRRVEATSGTATHRYRRPTRNLERNPAAAEDAIGIANRRRPMKNHQGFTSSNNFSD